MAKSSPEKLAAALRANLKRRKQTPVGQKAGEPGPPAKNSPAGPPSGDGSKSPKNSA